MQRLADEVVAQSQALKADLLLADAAELAVKQAVESFGPIDLLINNAGANDLGEPAGFEVARAEQLFALNVPPMRLVEAVLPAMRGEAGGRLLTSQVLRRRMHLE